MSEEWRKCSVCKKSINYGQAYQKCSVSTCKKNIYCSVDCWNVHVPIVGHKSAWAEEEIAPREATEDRPRRRIVVTPKSDTEPSNSTLNSSNLPHDVLIVVSKLKAYVKARSGMNTSGDVSDALSDIVRTAVDKALDEAREDGRKTLMARDFK